MTVQLEQATQHPGGGSFGTGSSIVFDPVGTAVEGWGHLLVVKLGVDSTLVESDFTSAGYLKYAREMVTAPGLIAGPDSFMIVELWWRIEVDTGDVGEIEGSHDGNSDTRWSVGHAMFSGEGAVAPPSIIDTAVVEPGGTTSQILSVPTGSRSAGLMTLSEHYTQPTGHAYYVGSGAPYDLEVVPAHVIVSRTITNASTPTIDFLWVLYDESGLAPSRLLINRVGKRPN